MNIIKKYNFDEKQISSICVQKTTTPRIWIGFKKNTSGICELNQYSVNNLNTQYYNISLSVDEITKIYFFGTRIYIAVDDDEKFLIYFTATSPLTQTTINIPSGINESVIDILDDGTYLYFLLPGENTTNAKILKFSTTMVLQDTIELTDAHNVNSFTIDSNGDIWCTTYEENSKLIRVYLDGGSYTFDVINLFQ
jgi:hypothetical protein